MSDFESSLAFLDKEIVKKQLLYIHPTFFLLYIEIKATDS